MITLIHGTDSYLSYKFLKEKREELEKKGYEVKTVNVDDEFEVSDASTLYAALTEQDLFGSQKALILKRIASADLFYKLGKPLKTTTKLFDAIKSSPNEVILWEDKLITQANPLFKLSKEIKTFTAPMRDYEISSYIQEHFKNISPDIKKIILTNIKTTDTNEIATEIIKLISTPINSLNTNNIVLTQNTPTWIISDAITNYVSQYNENNLKRLFEIINSVDEDIRYKLAVIQNHISEMIIVKHAMISRDKHFQDMFFPSRRAFVFQKIERSIKNTDIKELFNLYKKSLIIEYFLNNGLISESVALENIFIGDVKSMSWELLFD